MRYSFIFPLVFSIILSLLVGCSASTNNAPPNKNLNASQVPIKSPTPSEEETRKRREQLLIEHKKAIDEFIANRFSGWKLEGISSDFGFYCEEGMPCDLHITKSKESKVVSVVLKKFTRNDDSTYWFVYESRNIDLSQARISSIKDSERDNTLSNLDIDSCRDICNVAQEEDSIRDGVDYPEGYEDPRS